MPYPGPWQTPREHEVRLWPPDSGNAPAGYDPGDPWVEFLTPSSPDPDWRFSEDTVNARHSVNGGVQETDGGLYGTPGASECVFNHTIKGSSPGDAIGIGTGGTCKALANMPATSNGGSATSPHLRHEGEFVTTLGITRQREEWIVAALAYLLSCQRVGYAAETHAPPVAQWPAGAVGVEVEDPQSRTLLQMTLSPWTGGDPGFHCFVKDAGDPGSSWLDLTSETSFNWSSIEDLQSYPDAGGPGAGGMALDVGAAAALQDEAGLDAEDRRLPRFAFAWADGWPGTWGAGTTEWTARPFFWVTLRWRTARFRYLYAEPPPEVVLPGVVPPLRQHPRDDGLAASSARRIGPHVRSRQRSNRIGPGSYI